MLSSDRLILPGYSVLDTLHHGQTRVVYRARRDVDGASVIVKTPSAGVQPTTARAALEVEAGVLRTLEIPGVPAIVELEARGNRPALILEDLPGDTLATVIRANALSHTASLELAVQLAATLGAIHANGLIHRDINPNNILVDTASLHAAIIDFGLATQVDGANGEAAAGGDLEGTPAYMSPEQTGRTGWAVDHRADLYSLGATLYELFTGRLPFEFDDPLKIVHAHIALQPAAPEVVDSSVPAALGAVILKLLAKSPEERYQSCAGLAADLSHCLQEIQNTGSIPPFAVGAHDFAARLDVPERLYGREVPLAALEAAFQRATGNSEGELLLVAGYSGIGKTSLVQALKETVRAGNGQFVSGKFDQFVRGTPYTAVRQALAELAKHLLMESDDVVSSWRANLREALGSSGGVILDLLPEFEPILGRQPRVPELGPTEAQNRFNRIFGKFMGVLARPDQPLVLFLDDLQWIDSASLDLMRVLLSSGPRPGLLMIGAYRDNEVPDDHPLLEMLKELEGAGMTISRIHLEPLDQGALYRFVADTLRGSEEHSAPLAELVAEKTRGNPFFMSQFMRSLAQEHLLQPDVGAGVWAYDLDGIRGQPSTDNVVDLLASRIERLPRASAEVLETAACLGNRFDADTLAIASGQGATATRAALREALREGLVVDLTEDLGTPDLGTPSPDTPLGTPRSYRFLHDRVQQAAYALIPVGQRTSRHMGIGRALLQALDGPAREERVFELMDQLRPGLDLVEDGEERRTVFELAMAAGHKARAATAYAEALDYFQTAGLLLPSDAWTAHYTRAFAAYLCIAECQYLSGRFDEGFETLSFLAERAATALDRAHVQVVRAAQYETLSQYGEAVEALRAGLAELGIELPQPPDFDAALERELDLADEALGDREIGDLIDLPAMEDPTVKMCMRLLMVAWAPSYLRADTRMISWIPARMVRLSLEHGNTEESAFGYVLHGFTLGTRRGEYRRGQEFGLLALQLNEDLDDLRFRGKVHELFGCFVNQWRRPLKECIESQRTAFLAGIEGGDFAYGSYGGFVETWYVFLTRARLAGMEEQFAPTLEFLRSIKNDAFATTERLILNWALALRGLTDAPQSLNGHGVTEEAFLRDYEQADFFLVFYHTMKLHLHLTLGDWEAARASADKAGGVIHSVSGTVWPMLLRFYRAVAWCAACEHDRPQDARELEARLSDDVAQLGVWAENCPENFSHAHLLVLAELARIRGDVRVCEDLYRQAIEAARVRGFPGDLGLVNERYARYWLERDQERIGSLFLLEALRVYDDWGAVPKAERLAAELNALIGSDDGDPSLADMRLSLSSPEAALGTIRSPGAAFDFGWAMKAAGAIASEIELDKLLGTLMRTLLESSGAERGCLVLEREGEAFVRVCGDANTGENSVMSEKAEGSERVPLSVLRYVRRTATLVLLEAATTDPAFAEDPYMQRVKPRSVLCLPVHYQRQYLGAVYLENRVNPGAFSADHLHLLETLSAHAAIAIRNAELFDEVARLEERLRAENVYLQETIRTHHQFEEIIGESAALSKVLEQVEQVSATDSTVLILGETGTGKELLARAIHRLSPRCERPLVTVNCGAISPGLIESELFGHERGAFTGAVARKIGRFELANGSTLLLDEIGDLALDLQVKLLRVLQEGEIERVGGRETIPVDVRVIAGTHRDLESAVEEGSFRADLYYRLNVFPILNPPLRERREDIPLLARYFVMKDSTRLGKRIQTIPKRTMDALEAYSWPGNIRELRNVIERSIITSRGSALELGNWLRSGRSDPGFKGDQTLDEVQRDYIEQTLQRTGWVVSGAKGAAKRLGLKPTTLEARMKKLGIERPS